MSEFKVGDRVRLTGADWDVEEHGVGQGDIVTITSDRLHDGSFWANNEDWYIYEGYEAELVEDDNTPISKLGTVATEALRSATEVTLTVDPVSPAHYQFPGGAEVNDISQWLTSNAAQALQYIARSSRIDGKNKGDAREDISKAIKFLNFELNRLDIK